MIKSVFLVLVLLAILSGSAAFFSFKPPSKPAPAKPAVKSAKTPNSGRPNPAPEAYVPESKGDFLTASWRYNRPVKK